MNPRCLATSPVFKTGALNHSAISPDRNKRIIAEQSSIVNTDFRENDYILLIAIFDLGKNHAPGGRLQHAGYNA